MTSRRSFLKRIAAAVAIVAMAPRIAFGEIEPSCGVVTVRLTSRLSYDEVVANFCILRVINHGL